MSLLTNKQTEVVTSQTYMFQAVAINRDGSGKLYAIVKFAVLDQNGKNIGQKTIMYKGADYNTFWSSFNSGTYLYDELNTKLNLGIENIPQMESDFLNS